MPYVICSGPNDECLESMRALLKPGVSVSANFFVGTVSDTGVSVTVHIQSLICGSDGLWTFKGYCGSTTDPDQRTAAEGSFHPIHKKGELKLTPSNPPPTR